MEIKTKYNIGDDVWYFYGKYKLIVTTKIVAISTIIVVGNKLKIEYGLDDGKYYTRDFSGIEEKELFKSKDELLKTYNIKEGDYEETIWCA